jgi:hypothetical protein
VRTTPMTPAMVTDARYKTAEVPQDSLFTLEELK